MQLPRECVACTVDCTTGCVSTCVLNGRAHHASCFGKPARVWTVTMLELREASERGRNVPPLSSPVFAATSMPSKLFDYKTFVRIGPLALIGVVAMRAAVQAVRGEIDKTTQSEQADNAVAEQKEHPNP